MYSFQYVSGLKEEASRVPVAERGRFWADHVLTAPLDGDTEGWAARDVSLGTYMADYTYRDVVLAAFADAAMDPVIARDFLAVLDEHNNVPHERIPDGLSATIATRILNERERDPQARTLLMDWALQRVDGPERRLGAVMYAINNSQEADFASLFAVVEGLADRQLVEAAQTQLQERVVAAQEAAARRATQLAEEERQHRYQNLIHQDPTAAFAQIATDLSLTESNVAQLDVAGQSALLSALSGMMWRIAGGQAATLPPLATAVLERALAQQRLGVAGDYEFRGATTQYQQLPLLTATSPAEFRQRLAELDDGSEMTTDTISALYERWRERHIRTNTRQRNERVLASATANRLSAAAPEDFVVRASVGTAVIKYQSVDELIGDMWQYFVPTLGGESAVGQQGRARLLERDDREDDDVDPALDVLIEGSDARGRGRLEEEIRSWALNGQPEPYVNHEAGGGVHGTCLVAGFPAFPESPWSAVLTAGSRYGSLATAMELATLNSRNVSRRSRINRSFTMGRFCLATRSCRRATSPNSRCTRLPIGQRTRSARTSCHCQ